MAQAITCDGPQHGDEPVAAVLVITNVPEAEVSGLCMECSTGFALAWVQAFAPDMIAQPPAAEPKPPRARKPPAPEGGENDGSRAAPRPRTAARQRTDSADTGSRADAK